MEKIGNLLPAWSWALIFGGFFTLLIWEIIWFRQKRGFYPWPGIRVSLLVAAADPVTRVINQFLVGGLFLLASKHHLLEISMTGWQPFLGLFIGFEFFGYWIHRWSHAVRILWASHAVHHSVEEMILVNGIRQPATSVLQLFWVPIVLLVWLGFPPPAVVAVSIFSVIYQLFIHSAAAPRLGVLEWVFNTPVHHCIHHSSEEEHLDTNYGSTPIVFDRLFGTFKADDRRPANFGLHGIRAPKTFMEANFGEWIRLFKDLKASAGASAALRILFSSPSEKLLHRPSLGSAGAEASQEGWCETAAS